jgi:SAM-dependent methyltransferase
LSHALWRSIEAISFSRYKLQKPVLDLGCGFGEFSGIVYGKIECGLDNSRKDINSINAKNTYEKRMFADARKLPFENSSFHSVLSVSVLEHIRYPSKVLKEIYRILKKNGKFYFSVPTSDLYENLFIPKILKIMGLLKLVKCYTNLHKKIFKHISIYDEIWWINQLEKNKFKVTICEGTISKKALYIHELFLLTSLPSQIGRWLTGKRWIVNFGRVTLINKFFGKFIKQDKSSKINLFIAAEKV